MARTKGAAAAAKPDKKGRSGGGRKKADPPAPTTRATASEVVKMPSTKKLLSLLASGRQAYQDSRSIAGEFGALVKEMSENDNLHKKAFAWARMADRLEPEKLADLFDHFEHYCEVLGLNKRAKSVMRMDLNDDGKGEDDGETDVDGKIVRGAFPSPGGVAAE